MKYVLVIHMPNKVYMGRRGRVWPYPIYPEVLGLFLALYTGVTLEDHAV